MVVPPVDHSDRNKWGPKLLAWIQWLFDQAPSQEEVDDIRQDVTNAEGDIDTLQNDVGQLQTDITSKADQSDLDQLASDVGDINAGLTDMATETWVGTQLTGKSDVGHNHNASYYQKSESDALLTGKSDVGHNHNASYYQKSESDALLAAKVNDFDQYYTALITLGNGVDVLTTTELPVDHSVPENMELVRVETWGAESGSITLNTAKAPSLSVSFTDIDGAAPIAISSGTVNVRTTFDGWTTFVDQWDKVRTTVAVNAVNFKILNVCYCYRKARG